MAIATQRRPTSASAVITTFARRPTGVMFPKPIVENVSTLKKNARAKPVPRSRRALERGGAAGEEGEGEGGVREEVGADEHGVETGPRHGEAGRGTD